MHPEVLTQSQVILLPVIQREFAKEYYLAGGTAIAIQIGHRRSIDFDYSEKFDFVGDKVPESEIKAFLTKVALTSF